MTKETGSGMGAETMQRNLNKEREYDKIKKQLRDEFQRIDVNRDGTITIGEIIKFLNENTKGQVDTQHAEQIFN